MLVDYITRGSGPAVILLHGSMATKNQWRPLMHELVNNFKVIAMDLSGYGGTPYPANPEKYSLDFESGLLQEVINKELDQDEPYHLVGHSYGGVVALYHAYHAVEKICSLTTIEPMAYHLLEDNHEQLIASQIMVAELSADIAQGRNIEAAEKFIDIWMAPGTFQRLGQREREVLGDGVKKMVLDFQAASSAPLSLGDYTQLPGPFTVIAGKESPHYSVDISRRIVSGVENARLIWVEGGHFAPVTHYHLINPLLLDIIQSAAKGSAHQLAPCANVSGEAALLLK